MAASSSAGPSTLAGQTTIHAGVRVANYNVGAKEAVSHTARDKHQKLMNKLEMDFKYLERLGVSIVFIEDMRKS